MKPDSIILHHSLTKDGETVSWQAIRRYHLDLGWSDIGYHFGIELVNDHYEILLGRMSNVIGAHCRNGGMNAQSLGICFVGNFDIAPPDGRMLLLGFKLIHCLLTVFEIPKGNIFGHCDFANRTCPGELFPLEEFKKRG
uniref:Putative N-acetylmuramoyl-L-alanine amidase n=1 Tax=viral metagenome TaxID=1070528 RepID=A0A6M3KW65_9ZZZZ